MTFTQNRYYSNIAAITTLTTTGGLSATSTSLVTASQNGWPTSFPFIARIEPSTVNEELVLVNSGNGTISSPYIITRGYDGTANIPHLAGVVVSHGMAQVDLQEPQIHMNLMSGTATDQNGHLAHGLPPAAWSNPIQTSTSASFTSIPSTYTHLRIIGCARNNTAGTVSLQFNNDSTISRYSIVTERNLGVTANTAVNTAQGSSNNAIGYAETSSGLMGYYEIFVPFYSTTMAEKMAVITSWAYSATAARWSGGITNLWYSQGVIINAIAISGQNTWNSDTLFNLYGEM